MEPVTTTTTVTTSSFVMPSPTQLIIGGVALGIGLTAGYGLACWTASLVDKGLDKSGIKDRVASLMDKSEEAEEEVAELEDSEEEVEEVKSKKVVKTSTATVKLNPKARKEILAAFKAQGKMQKIKWDQNKFDMWADKNAKDLNYIFKMKSANAGELPPAVVGKMVAIGAKLNQSAAAAGLVKK